jgi:hypothetical protein
MVPPGFTYQSSSPTPWIFSCHSVCIIIIYCIYSLLPSLALCISRCTNSNHTEVTRTLWYYWLSACATALIYCNFIVCLLHAHWAPFLLKPLVFISFIYCPYLLQQNYYILSICNFGYFSQMAVMFSLVSLS